jgi:hypothetical protein
MQLLASPRGRVAGSGKAGTGHKAIAMKNADREAKFPTAYRSGRGHRPRLFSRLTAAITALAFAAVHTGQASAQSLSLIRDAETEALIAGYSAPIFKAAGLTSHNIKVHLINDTSFNAFVINGQHMFINTGAITQSETPNELIGVIAHETGHIKGGHNARLRDLMNRMQTAALLLTALSAAAMVGGAVSGSGETAQAGGAMMMGGQQVLNRSILSYVRQQESAADRQPGCSKYSAFSLSSPWARRAPIPTFKPIPYLRLASRSSPKLRRRAHTLTRRIAASFNCATIWCGLKS